MCAGASFANLVGDTLLFHPVPRHRRNQLKLLGDGLSSFDYTTFPRHLKLESGRARALASTLAARLTHAIARVRVDKSATTAFTTGAVRPLPVVGFV